LQEVEQEASLPPPPHENKSPPAQQKSQHLLFSCFNKNSTISTSDIIHHSIFLGLHQQEQHTTKMGQQVSCCCHHPKFKKWGVFLIIDGAYASENDQDYLFDLAVEGVNHRHQQLTSYFWLVLLLGCEWCWCWCLPVSISLLVDFSSSSSSGSSTTTSTRIVTLLRYGIIVGLTFNELFETTTRLHHLVVTQALEISSDQRHVDPW